MVNSNEEVFDPFESLDEADVRRSDSFNKAVRSGDDEITTKVEPDQVQHHNTKKGIDSCETEVDAEAKNDFKAFYQLRELIESEYVYLDSLKTVKKHYMETIDSFKQSKVEQSLKDKLFGNILEVLGLNQALVDNLEGNLRKIGLKREYLFETKVEAADASELKQKLMIVITESFINILPKFKTVYSKYAKNLSNSLKVLNSYAQIPWFKSFLENQKDASGSGGLLLNALLIQPIQRICRYTLFFSGIENCTEKDDKHYNKLLAAKSLVDELTNTVNQEKGEAENDIRRIEIWEQLLGLEKFHSQIKDPKSELMHEGVNFLSEWNTSAHVVKQADVNDTTDYWGKYKVWMWFFLFSDFLIVTKPSRSYGYSKYKVKAWIPLKELIMETKIGEGKETTIEILHVYERTHGTSESRMNFSRFIPNTSSAYRINEDPVVYKRTIVEKYCLEFDSCEEKQKVAKAIIDAKQMKPEQTSSAVPRMVQTKKHVIKINPKVENASRNAIDMKGFTLAPPSTNARDRSSSSSIHLSLTRPKSGNPRTRRKSMPLKGSNILQSVKGNDIQERSSFMDNQDNDLKKELDDAFGMGKKLDIAPQNMRGGVQPTRKIRPKSDSSYGDVLGDVFSAYEYAKKNELSRAG